MIIKCLYIESQINDFTMSYEYVRNVKHKDFDQVIYKHALYKLVASVETWKGEWSDLFSCFLFVV